MVGDMKDGLTCLASWNEVVLVIEIIPSLMCADFRTIEHELQELDVAGSDAYHLDVMDGSFVPNFALGVHDIEAIRAVTSKRLDVHLMVEEPENKVALFARLGCDRIFIHAEATRQLHCVLTAIAGSGKRAGVVLNPGSPVSAVEEVLGMVDAVILMAVNPGYAGQPFIESTVSKAARLVSLIREQGASAEVIVDGHVNIQTVPRLARQGVNGFVAGTAGLFHEPHDYAARISELRESGARALFAS